MTILEMLKKLEINPNDEVDTVFLAIGVNSEDFTKNFMYHGQEVEPMDMITKACVGLVSTLDGIEHEDIRKMSLKALSDTSRAAFIGIDNALDELLGKSGKIDEIIKEFKKSKKSEEKDFETKGKVC